MNHVFYPEYTATDKELQNTKSDQLNKTTEFSLDYQHPLSDFILLEGGYRFSQQDLLNDFSSESFHLLSEVWQNDNTLDNRFHYLQNMNAAYLNLEAQLKYFNLQLGIRGEHTMNNQFVKAEEYYFNFFPSAR